MFRKYQGEGIYPVCADEATVPIPDYVNRDEVHHFYIRPGGDIELVKIDYKLDRATHDFTDVKSLNSAILSNNSANTVATEKFGYSYSHQESKTWSFSNALTVGVKVSGSAGVPLLEGSTVEVSVSDTFTFGMTKEKTDTTIYTAETDIQVGPKSRVLATAMLRQGHLIVPFTTTLRIKGTETTWEEEGAFETFFSRADVDTKDVKQMRLATV